MIVNLERRTFFLPALETVSQLENNAGSVTRPTKNFGAVGRVTSRGVRDDLQRHFFTIVTKSP